MEGFTNAFNVWELVNTFNQARWDTGDCPAYTDGYFDGDAAGNTDRMTIVKAGWYIASATFSWVENAGGQRGLRVYWTHGVTTVYIASQRWDAAKAGTTDLCISAPPHWMDVGDTVRLYAFQDGNAGGLAANITARYSVEFGIVRVP